MTKKLSYWECRHIQDSKRTFQSTEEYVNSLRKEYDLAIQGINEKIYYHMEKLAEHGGVDLATARKWLNDSELKGFKLSLEEFREKSKGYITPEIEKELELMSRRQRISRLQAMETDLKANIHTLMSREEQALFSKLGDTYIDSYYREVFNLSKITSIDNIKSFSKYDIENIVKSPWHPDGKVFSASIWSRRDKLVEQLQKELTQGMMRGISTQRIAKNISNCFETSFNNAKRLVRTEVNAIHMMARQDSFNDLNVEKYQILAALDNRTSEICRELDEKVYDMKDYKVGITAPPFHPNCRSVTIPYIDDDIQREVEENTGRMARNPETGKSERVENLSYKHWRDKYVISEDALKAMDKRDKYYAKMKKKGIIVN